MRRPSLLASLIPAEAETDKGFRQEIQRLSHRALLIMGIVHFVTPLFVLLARFVVVPEPSTLLIRVEETLTLALLGGIYVSAARSRKLYRQGRTIALTLALLSMATLITFTLLQSMAEIVPTQVAMVLLVTLALLPVTPLQTLLFGITTGGIYVTVSQIIYSRLGLTATADPIHLLSISILTLISTVVSAAAYNQRYSVYRSYLNTLQASEDIRLAQSRVLLSEHAASLGRLAAALSHELNSPIGALISGIDTLLLLASRQATSPPDQQQRLVILQNDLRKSIRDSAERLKQLVQRMQRFTNLDRAEVQTVTVNELLTDVVNLLEPETRKVSEIALKLEPTPPIVCRPQRLSAVFFNIVSNGLNAVNNNGSGGGTVTISTHNVDHSIEVHISDNGRGMDRDQVRAIFDPGFQTSGGRMAAVNWSMFSSRQIVREHGGEIKLESEPGAGTTVSIMLPVDTHIPADAPVND